MSSSQKRARIALISLVGIILALVGLTGLHANDVRERELANQTAVPRIVNLTTALKASSASVTGEAVQVLQLSLVNESSRNINGYVLTIGNLSITTDLASVGEVMEPGVSRQEIIPIGNLDVAESQAPRMEREVTIAALSFEGFSGEGDSHALKLLLERHRGIRDQVEILLPRLREMKAQPSSRSTADELEKLATRLSREVDQAKQSPNLAEGRRWISDQFRKQLRDSKGHVNLDDVVAFYEHLLSRI